ncbi:MAG TPA: NADH-quinone oxidoreductase subunit H [Candidatus Binatia bacterium]|nr:NADH-quinone oxidoreductase subunit H [Candidatus Binatia bacterium]
MRTAVACTWAALLLLALPPLLLGIVVRVKAIAAGRAGAPLLQGYRDLARLLRKTPVYSGTTTWVFRAGPIVALAATAAAGCLLPLGAGAALLAFEGDLVLFAYLLGLGRFAMMSAALDTGSSFEGMGASREAAIGSLGEVAVFLVLVTLVVATGELSLSAIFAGLDAGGGNPALWLAAAALAAVLLAENARIPIDDPTTHLELTMVHEVMALDHSGPDLAFVEYGAAMKLAVTSALLVGLVWPAAARQPIALAGGMIAVAVAIGLVESAMARLRLPRVKQYLIGSAALAGVALAAELVLRGAA